jgi:hypothetical protein
MVQIFLTLFFLYMATNLLTLFFLYMATNLLSSKMSCGRSGPKAGRFTLVGRTVRACTEQIRVPSFVLRLLAIFVELAREISL